MATLFIHNSRNETSNVEQRPNSNSFQNVSSNNGGNLIRSVPLSPGRVDLLTSVPSAQTSQTNSNSFNPSVSNLANMKWGSWHCTKFRNGGKCDLCSHIKERETIESQYYITKFKIHGHLRHDFSPQGKIRWFVYGIEDEPCHKVIVGSTQDPTKRWANHKTTCNKKHLKVQIWPNTLWMVVLLTLVQKK